MQRQQIVFGMSSGVCLSALGGFLALGGIADWSLFAVGVGLMGIAFAYSVQGSARSAREQAVLAPIDSLSRR